MKKILFLGYGGGHINALIPVIKECAIDNNYELCVIGINLAVDILRKNNIPCKTLSDYLTDDILQIGRPLALRYHNFDSVVSYADSISCYGFSMYDLIQKVGLEFANDIFRIYDRRLFLPVESMKKILMVEKPDVIVVTTMHRFEAATILAAKELGIPSIKIEDLVGNIQIPFPDKIQVKDEQEFQEYLKNGFSEKQLVLKSDLEKSEIKKYCQSIYHIYQNMRPDRICVVSDFVKKRLVKKGYRENQIIVTGQPAFDRLKHYEELDTKKIIESLGLDINKPILSFMSQPLSNREKILKEIILGLKNIEDLQFIIKLHPNEDGEIQKLVLKELNYNALIISDLDAPTVMKISTITSTVSSTTGLEAACLDKNLIYFNFENNEDFVPYQEMGIGVRVATSKELETAITNFLTNSYFQVEMKKRRKGYIHNFNAASHVKKVIDTVIGVDICE